MATRIALGAGRGRVVSQLLTESLVLGLLGGGAGVVLAAWGLSALPALTPELPRIDGIALDARVLGFTALVTLTTSVVFGLMPAVQASRPDLVGALKEGGHGASGGRGRRRARSLLVVGEVALALVLLIGAGLLIRSFWLLQQVDPGFDADNVLVVGLSLPDATYPEPAMPDPSTDNSSIASPPPRASGPSVSRSRYRSSATTSSATGWRDVPSLNPARCR
ncbi:MAG: hypothetical protein QGF21_07150 [Vicinamibacterales bacterium]|nr:hypothetical protein [Vicinamibacterales bacterium]MDP7671702.1 hypothetical protein [Vicinamibacterales bacterium]HJO39147.1 hypothetical protein [Vicinamibacterales bacterium]